MTTKGENGLAEDLCDVCTRAVNYTLHYLRLCHQFMCLVISSLQLGNALCLRLCLLVKMAFEIVSKLKWFCENIETEKIRSLLAIE